MTNRKTQRIIEDMQGLPGQGFLLTVHLRSFAESMAFSANMRQCMDDLLADMQADPEHWFDKWGQALGMEAQRLVYLVGAQTLLKEYTREYLEEVSRKQLEGK